jgi:hypothetical protein
MGSYALDRRRNINVEWSHTTAFTSETGDGMLNPDINVGDVTFLRDGGNPIGTVHQLSPDGRPEFVIYVENGGDFVVPFVAIQAVHFGKIILDVHRLNGKLRAAIGHAHDHEAPE